MAGVAFAELDGFEPGGLFVPQSELFEVAEIAILDFVKDLPASSFTGNRVEHVAVGDVVEVETVAGQFAVLPSEQVGQFDPSSGIVVIGSLAADLVQVFGGKLRECFDPGTALDEVFGEGLFRDIELFGERSDGECFGWYESMG